MKTILYSFGSIIIGLLLGLIIIFFSQNYKIIEKTEYRSLVKMEEYYSNHLYKYGGSEEFGSYNLRSFDNGVTWYSFDNDTLLGHVDSIHPGLMKYLNDWDNILLFKENGEIRIKELEDEYFNIIEKIVND